jgi:hypothetical protein
MLHFYWPRQVRKAISRTNIANVHEPVTEHQCGQINFKSCSQARVQQTEADLLNQISCLPQALGTTKFIVVRHNFGHTWLCYLSLTWIFNNLTPGALANLFSLVQYLRVKLLKKFYHLRSNSICPTDIWLTRSVVC